MMYWKIMKRTLILTALALGLAVLVPYANAEEPPPKMEITAFSFADTKDGEAWCKFRFANNAALTFQTHVTWSKSGFVYVAAGRYFQLAKGLEVELVAGPQYSYDALKDSGGFDRVALFANATYEVGGFKLLSINRVFGPAFGEDGPWIDRHVQSLHLPGTPDWLQLRTEELHNSDKGWTELYLGAIGTLKVHGFEVKLYPYYDFATENVRLWTYVARKFNVKKNSAGHGAN